MTTLKKIMIVFVLAAFVLCGMFTYLPAARADLLIMPVRVVFKDRDRMKAITIANTSEEEGTFRFSFYYQVQNSDGGYSQETDAASSPFDISKMIIFSPRQVHLPPSGKQSVRLSLRKPEELADGEYRTHMRISRMAGPADRSNSAPKKGAQVAASIGVAFSIPIMMRKGVYDTTAKIGDLKFMPAHDKKPPSVAFKINRSGKYSALGRVTIYWTPPGGSEQIVGLRNQVNIFPEVNVRNMDIALQKSDVAGGTLRVVFEGDDADKGIMFDQKTLQL